jgi:hypothetical protein
MGEKKNAYKLLVGKPEGRRPLGRPRRRWVDNIKMGLLEIGWRGVVWIGRVQDRDKWRALVNAVMNLRVPLNAGKLSNGYIIGGLPSSSQFHRVTSLSLFFPSFVRLIDVFNTLLVFSTLLSLL